MGINAMSSTSILLVLIAIAVFVAVAYWLRRTKAKRELAEHTVTPSDLHKLLAADNNLLLYDVRQPLDLLADSEIIPGAQRIPPTDIEQNPSLLPRDREFVVYCTCPGDKTSRSILDRALALGFNNVKFLRGGLADWKAQGYPVERYDKPFRLDTIKE
jgi:rhodanese-related sulfurtransferase